MLFGASRCLDTSIILMILASIIRAEESPILALAHPIYTGPGSILYLVLYWALPAHPGYTRLLHGPVMPRHVAARGRVRLGHVAHNGAILRYRLVTPSWVSL